MSRKGRGDAKVAVVYLLPVLFFWLVYVAYPLITNITNSLYKWRGISGRKTFVGWANYGAFFHKPLSYAALWHNAVFLAFGLLVVLPMAYVTAYLLCRHISRPLSGFFKLTYFFPVVMNMVVIGTVWKLFFNPQIGLLNQLLGAVGLEHLRQPWLGAQATALPSLLLVSLWVRIGYYIVIYVTAIKSIPSDMWDTLELEGAGFVRSSLLVVLPLISPVVAASVTMLIIYSINDFGMVWVTTQGGPVDATEILGTYMFKEAFRNFKMGYASAIVVVMIVVALALSVLQMRGLEKNKAEF